MTDTEIKRRIAICEVAGVKEIDDLSDGFHTFRQLYYQRMMLFAVIVKQNHDRAWKSLRHEDGGLCFGGGWFIVGIDTPEGSYTYHYEDSYFSLFDCEELEYAKHWDGHTEKDVTRLLSLTSAQPETNCSEFPNNSDTISRQAAIDAIDRITRTDNWQAAVSMALLGLPPVQPEIIRCTECKHYREYDSKYVENAVIVQCMADRYPISETIPDGWFCAGAERRTDE